MLALLTILLLGPFSYGVTPDEVFERILDWVQTHKRMPEVQHFGFEPDQIPFSYQRLTTQKNSLFEDSQDLWIQFKAYAQKYGVEVRLREVMLRKPLNDAFKLHLREEVLHLILRWVRAHSGRLPDTRDFGTSPGQVHFDVDRLTGLHALYSDAQEFWREFKKFAEAQGERIFLIHVNFRGPLDGATRAILQEEAHELVLDWILKNKGQLPKRDDFGCRPGQIPVLYYRLTATASYAPGKFKENAAIFSSPQDFWIRQKRYARKMGVEIYLHQLTLRRPLLAEMISLLEEEALDQGVRDLQDLICTPVFEDL